MMGIFALTQYLHSERHFLEVGLSVLFSKCSIIVLMWNITSKMQKHYWAENAHVKFTQVLKQKTSEQYNIYDTSLFPPSLSLPAICGMRKHNSGIIIPVSQN